jgi:acyl-[acyl-carrier-protein] desaturase
MPALPGRREAMAELERRLMNGDISLRTVTAQKGIVNVWQPSDLLTADMVGDVRAQMNKLSPQLLIVLVGDTLTEEGLPTYTSRIFQTEGLPTETGDPHSENRPLSQWIRQWTAEEARHGTLLDRLLFLSDRIDQRAREGSKQLLIEDGMDIGVQTDPYKGFYYTSFQERATQVSHMNVARRAEEQHAPLVAEICRTIAKDETAHGKIYSDFAQVMLQSDPNGMIKAIAEMMEHGVVMPAHNMREVRYRTGEVLAPGASYDAFSVHAQRVGVYTTQDYAEISGQLLKKWGIAERHTDGKWNALPVQGVNDDEAADAQKRIVRLQNIVQRRSDKWTPPADAPEHEFSWLVDRT